MLLTVPAGTRCRAARRSGFTLLELLLAAVLAAALLTALYMAMSVTVRQTQVSRDASDVEHLYRGVFNKLSTDLSGTLAPLPPKSGGNAAASGGTVLTATDTGATAPATGATGTSGTAPANRFYRFGNGCRRGDKHNRLHGHWNRHLNAQHDRYFNGG